MVTRTDSPRVALRAASRLARTRFVGSLVPIEELSALRVARGASGYRNVYRHRDGFVAKVKERGRLLPIPHSRHASPHVSAAFVVAWYMVRFGARWREAVANRRRLYWRAWRDPQTKAWHIVAWVRGVMRLGENPLTGRPWEYPTRFAAQTWAKKILLQDTAPLWRAC